MRASFESVDHIEPLNFITETGEAWISPSGIIVATPQPGKLEHIASWVLSNAVPETQNDFRDWEWPATATQAVKKIGCTAVGPGPKISDISGSSPSLTIPQARIVVANGLEVGHFSEEEINAYATASQILSERARSVMGSDDYREHVTPTGIELALSMYSRPEIEYIAGMFRLGRYSTDTRLATSETFAHFIQGPLRDGVHIYIGHGFDDSEDEAERSIALGERTYEALTEGFELGHVSEWQGTSTRISRERLVPVGCEGHKILVRWQHWIHSGQTTLDFYQNQISASFVAPRAVSKVLVRYQPQRTRWLSVTQERPQALSP